MWPGATRKPSSDSVLTGEPIEISPIFTNTKFSKKQNKVSNSKYTLLNFLFKFLHEQFSNLANVYFLLISLLQQVPDISPTGKYTTIGPLIVVLLVAGSKEIYEDWKRRVEDNTINHKKCLVWRWDKVQQIFMWVEVFWMNVNKGDIVKVHRDETFPVDLILLASSEDEDVCHIETANLDGETNLKMRQANTMLRDHFFQNAEDPTAVKLPENHKTCFTVERPNKQIYTFRGNARLVEGDIVPLSATDLLLRETMLRNTKYIIGFAVYTSMNCKIYKNASRPPIKISNVQRKTNHQVVYLFMLVLLMSGISLIGTIVDLSKGNTYWYMPGQAMVSAVTHTNTTHLSRINAIDSDPITFTMCLKQFLTFVILYNTIIPISLVLNLDFTKMFLAGFINDDLEMYDPETKTFSRARTSTLVEELGQVKYIFSDKTGTLTRNIMEFKYASISGSVFDPAHPLYQKPCTRQDHEFFEAMSLCHSAIPEADGDGNFVYKAASPDEEALVAAAARCVYQFTNKLPSSMTVKVESSGECRVYEILTCLEFTSARQCMSIILRELFGERRILLFTKGSDTVIFRKVGNKASRFPHKSATNQNLSTFAKEGLRTLCYATRTLTETEYRDWHNEFRVAQASLTNREEEMDRLSEEIETGLRFLGASAIEDRLQDNVPETIDKLQNSGIHIWMLTGDKIETAQNIAYSACLLRDDSHVVTVQEEDPEKLAECVKSLYGTEYREILKRGDKRPALIISGASLGLALRAANRADFLKFAVKCHTVICARVTPSQKAEVVKRVKRYLGSDCITLAIGDGANDVPMIQSANLGIGISGQEGLQAANSSDYSIPQFRFLEKLLLVHGSWSYHRISKAILYFFYKNTGLHMSQQWFAPFNLYSGQNMYENWSLAAYNAIFLAMPPLAIGIFEKPYPKKYLLEVPTVYQQGQQSQKFNGRLFACYLLNSLYHSLCLFFLISNTVLHGMPFSDGSVAGLDYLGNMMYGSTLLLATIKAQTECTGLTVPHIFLIWSGPFMWLIYMVGYSNMFPAYDFAATMTGMSGKLFGCPVFWLAFIVFPMFVALPDVMWHIWKSIIFKSEILKEGQSRCASAISNTFVKAGEKPGTAASRVSSAWSRESKRPD